MKRIGGRQKWKKLAFDRTNDQSGTIPFVLLRSALIPFDSLCLDTQCKILHDPVVVEAYFTISYIQGCKSEILNIIRKSANSDRKLHENWKKSANYIQEFILKNQEFLNIQELFTPLIHGGDHVWIMQRVHLVFVHVYYISLVDLYLSVFQMTKICWKFYSHEKIFFAEIFFRQQKKISLKNFLTWQFLTAPKKILLKFFLHKNFFLLKILFAQEFFFHFSFEIFTKAVRQGV